jgi:sporulation protein YtfJ
MSEKNLEGMINISLEKVKGMVDSNSIIGAPISIQDGTTIIPVSKVSVGFGCGGSDFPSASPKEMFGGDTGGGVTIQPVAFLILKGDSVRMIQLADKNSVAERVANMVPDAIDTFSSLLSKKKTDNVTVEPAEPAVIEKVQE